MSLIRKIKEDLPAWRRLVLFSLAFGGIVGGLDVVRILVYGGLTPTGFLYLVVISCLAVSVATGLLLSLLLTILAPRSLPAYLSRPVPLRVPARSLVTGLLVLLATGLVMLAPLNSRVDRRLGDRLLDVSNRPPATSPSRENPNVILLVLDTVRRDHLSLYGYHRPTTPHLDRWSADFLVCTGAISASPWTVPSHATLFTGLYPAEHGAHSFLPERYHKQSLNNVFPLDRQLTTLAETLRGQGYATAGLVSNPFLSPVLGFGQGFSTYLMKFNANSDVSLWSAPLLRLLFKDRWRSWREKPQQSAYQLNRLAGRWLRRMADRPFFLFVNYMDAHDPCLVPPPFSRAFPGRMEGFRLDHGFREIVMGRQRTITGEESAHLQAAYDGSILYLDHHLDRLLEQLKEMGLYENSLIVITSDHGEYFGEHQLLDHGKDVYREVLDIPLLIKFPGDGKRGKLEQRVHLIDILPTITAALGIETPPHLPGRDLGRSVEGIPLVSENYFARYIDLKSSYGDRFRRIRRALYSGDWKYIQSSDGRHELYRLSDDPSEAQNLMDRMPEQDLDLSRMLEGLVHAQRQGQGERSIPELDEETREKLKRLGYM